VKKKLFIAAQIVLVVILFSCIAYSFLKPTPKPEFQRDAWHSWKGFFAISYQGISKKDGKEYVSEKQLGAHLEALKIAGYHTITPADAAAFLGGMKPLPEKAILVIFEGGRKDSLLSATPSLRKTGFSAVMCVPTKLTDTWENFYLSAKELKGVAEDPAWSLCSMGHKAVDLIPAGPSGGKDHYLTGLLSTPKGAEGEKEYAERVAGDYAKASGIIEKAMGKPAEMYLYPYADTGERPGSRPLAAEVNLEAVKKYHKMAFVRGDDAFNAWKSDPYRLNRLRVSAGWDAERLLKELERFAPRTAAVEAIPGPDEWTVSGDVKNSGKLLLNGPAGNAFLRGTDEWANAEVSATVRLGGEATAFVYGRYGSPRSYVRASLHKSGVRLQECSGRTMQTLAWQPTKIDLAKEHSLTLRFKGNRAWTYLDGAVVAGPVPLAASIGRGRIGVGSQDGPVEFASLKAGPIPFRYLLADVFSSLPKEAARDAGAILPVWFREGAQPSVDRNRAGEVLLAASQGTSTIPVIEAPKALEAAKAEAFVEGIGKALGGPLTKPLVNRLALSSPDNGPVALIRAKGFMVVRIMSTEEAREVARRGIKPEDGDMILVDGNGKEMTPLLEQLLHTVPSDRVIAAVDEQTAARLGVGVLVRPGKH